jgi:hypothetical protein
MTHEEKMTEMAKTLLRQTEEGILEWEETADEKQFQLPRKDYALISGLDRQGESFLRIINNNGKVVETFKPEGYATLTELVHSLYEAARRNALKVDDTVDRIMDDLKDPP